MTDEANTREELVRLRGILDDADISKKAGKIKNDGRAEIMEQEKYRASFSPLRIIRTLKIISLINRYRFYSARKLLTLFARTETRTTGDVTYRVAERLTALNHVYKTVDDAQVEITPLSVDLYHGEFVLSASDARDGEDPVEVYCDCVGICDEGETFAIRLA